MLFNYLECEEDCGYNNSKLLINYSLRFSHPNSISVKFLCATTILQNKHPFVFHIFLLIYCLLSIYFFLLCQYILSKDAWSSKDGREIIIDHQQDCISIARTSKDEIAFRRKFDTCDEDDFPFHEGTMYIYWMRGEELLELDDDRFPTPDLPESDFGMSHLQLLRADSISIPEK